MWQAFTCQGSGKFLSFPALAGPDTTIKAQELMIALWESSRSQAAGLGSVLDQLLQHFIHAAPQYEAQNPSGEAWSTRSIF